ncbi:MAG: helix-turn-helix domain-containing protein [Defluviitaleaceae bacterium]|nr:helix-turn-helix domain-containing protein [Defluviitaleaceae bacterium]
MSVNIIYMIKKEFVDRLKTLRTKAGLSQREIINTLKIGSRSYEHYESENSKRIPEYKNLIALASFFNCSIDYLLCQTNNPVRNL